jgi:phenylalanyl-tRNA synthetase beta chain
MMKFTLSSLRTHLETTASLEAISEKLTALGLEVEAIHNPAASLAPFTIAEVREAVQHPNADRLRVTKVWTGTEELQIVCGAPNCRAGMKTVLGRAGDYVPGRDLTLKKSKIRDVESNGMLLSEAEMGLPETIDGIIDLPADAPVGKSFVDYAHLDDPVIEIKLTPNRADCAGIRGIARDLAAAGLGTLKAQTLKAINGSFKSPVSVTLDFADDTKKDCPHFVGRLIRNIKNGAAPKHVHDFLKAVGQKPISALVDVTNYLTLDQNRPLHVFDAKKLKGNIRLYAAKGGETFLALNGKDYEMQPGMTVIADDTGMISLAGIMGGETTKCDENTTDVFIEAAYFYPPRVAKTGRALGVSSDARYRFERGIDPAFTEAGIEMATALILEWCGTDKTEVSELVIAGRAPKGAHEIIFNPDLTEKLLGVSVPIETQITILKNLGCQLTAKGSSYDVITPSWRPDLVIPQDLVEEIIRVHGFEHLAETSLPRPHVVAAAGVTPTQKRMMDVKRALAAHGMMECVTWAFMSSLLAKDFAPNNPLLRLQNPISSELDIMRPSTLPNLMMAAARNAARGFADAALFEVGPNFHSQLPEGQRIVATGLRHGNTPRHWAAPARAVDCFDAKADMLAALAALGINEGAVQVSATAPAYYHPGQSGTFKQGPHVFGTFGALHPRLLAEQKIDGAVVGFELFLDAIPFTKATSKTKSLLKVDALQPVTRDFAFMVERSVNADVLSKAVKDAEKTLIRDVTVFDIYEGKGVAEGHKSVALQVTLQPTDASFDAAALEAIATRIADNVKKATGGTLRV